MEKTEPRPQGLSAPYVLEYVYRRSVGPTVGRFLGALREGRIEAVRTRSGRVVVPPLEYDPETGEPAGEMIAVANVGVVTSWSWVEATPRGFAWALVRLDGADTALLHKVEAPSAERMHTGMRVRARFVDEASRRGDIRDIACFEPETRR